MSTRSNAAPSAPPRAESPTPQPAAADDGSRVVGARALAGGAALVLALFGIGAVPLAFVGEPRPADAALAALPAPPSFVIVGDSRAHQALSPRLMSEAFARAGLAAPGGRPLPAHNLAIDGTDVVNHASLVATLSRLDAPPRLILWATNPLGFDASRTTNRLEQLHARDVPTLLAVGAPMEVVLDTFTMALFAPYRHRVELRDKLDARSERIGAQLTTRLADAAGMSTRLHVDSRTFREDPDGRRAFEITGEWSGPFAARAADYAEQYAKLELAPWKMALARRLARAVSASGGRLVMVELPVAPLYQRRFAGSAVHRGWRDSMEKLAAEEDALFILDADHEDDDRKFGDPGHMARPLGDAYSTDLAARLAALPRVRAALGPR
jgi:hypothetical protein